MQRNNTTTKEVKVKNLKNNNSKKAPSKGGASKKNASKALNHKGEKAKPKHLQKPDPIKEKSFLKQSEILGLDLSQEQASHLRNYLDTLMLWNTKINLVGTLEWQETFAELLLDSFYLADFIKTLSIKENPTTWDLGAGAGLPGIPLRMAWKEGSYTLVEAREKRALFMTSFLLKKPLVSTSVFWGRAEKLFAQQEAKQALADVIVSRAFMPYEELAEFVFPYINEGGTLLLMLNESLKKLPESMEGKWKIEKSVQYSVKDTKGKDTVNQRYFHALKKIS